MSQSSVSPVTLGMMTARELPAPAPPLSAPSFEALLDLHGAEVYRHLRRLSVTPDDAADLHQETYLRAYRAWPGLPAEANHRAWLHRIAANVAVDAHRRRAVRAAVMPPPPPASSHGDGSRAGESPTALEPRAGGATDPAARVEAAELREAIRQALVALPGRERAAVVSRVLDGNDYAEVAALLDCSEPTARQLVSRGLRRVRAVLAAFLEIDR
jgi:RNA polymerase sigma factor (sigma-70 family)